MIKSFKKVHIIASTVISVSIVLLAIFFSQNTNAWEGCCSPSAGDSFHGYWFSGCCYDGGDECCTVDDAEDSGCNEIIPCTGPGCDPGDPGDDPSYECNDCDYGNCPSPLQNTGEEEYKLPNYRSCQKTGDCDDWMYGDCYEDDNSDIPGRETPTASLVVNPNGTPTSLGFTSSTYTGKVALNGDKVNEPINLIATFTDQNGANDIEAGYVWLKTDSVAPNTPEYYDPWFSTTGKTFTTNSFGFMMHKESGTWNPYVIRQDGSYYTWVRSTYSGNDFYIYGPSSTPITKVHINSVSPSGNSVTMDFTLYFNETTDLVQNGKYNIFVMANDVFGFTPYDNYAHEINIEDYWNQNQIRDYLNWSEDNDDWNIDLEKPTVNNLEVSVYGTSGTKLLVSWTVHDTQRLSTLVGNVYASEGIESPTPITFETPGFTINPSYIFQHQPAEELPGHLTNGFAFKKTNLNTTDSTDSMVIDIGTNRGGSLIIYLTVFDYGGNIQGGDSESYEIYDLKDWMISRGGLVYSSSGIGFDTKSLSAGLWIATILNNVGLLSDKADISTEMFSDIRSVSSNPLINASKNSSYYINNVSVLEPMFYADLLKSFNNKLSTISNITPVVSSTLSDELCSSGDCNSKIFYKIPASDNENLTVSADFNCNSRGIFFVSGNLNITPNLMNTNNQKDACIFVVKGNVNIKAGTNKPGMGYDEINAFIITDNRIIIEPEIEGILVKGGLIGYGNDTILMQRYWDLLHKSEFPALAVVGHSKYGIFSKEVIGNIFNIVKTEVGYKPY